MYQGTIAWEFWTGKKAPCRVMRDALVDALTMVNDMHLLVVLLFGLCIGSFLNVCIYRLPKEKSIVRPHSQCPACGNFIKWYDNIPVLSFILLRAKCRNCRVDISWRYPLVEALTALTLAFLYIKFGLSFGFFKFALFFLLLIVVSFIDIDYHAIPVYFCFIGIAAGPLFGLAETFKMAHGAHGMVPEIQAMPVILRLKDWSLVSALPTFLNFSAIFFLGSICILENSNQSRVKPNRSV